MTTSWPLAPSSTTKWLLDHAGDGLTAFTPPRLPDAAWVLNAMYEHEQGPSDVSYDEAPRARLADGSLAPDIVGASTSTEWGPSPEATWAVLSTPALAGGACAGRSLPGGPVTRWCLKRVSPLLMLFLREDGRQLAAQH